MLEDSVVSRGRLNGLRREWLLALALDLFLWVGTYALLREAWAGAERIVWAGVSAVLLAYQTVYLWRKLAQNFPPGAPGALYPTLGLGNWITQGRAALLALLTGFLLLPRPNGWAAWLPGGLYLAAAVLDYLDGWAARATRRTSQLGEILDLHWDGYGVLVASLLLARYGQAPVWYVLVGLARYLFLLGLWLRERRGLENYAMQPSVMRRALAGVQMGFIAAILLPVLTPPATRVAATLFMLPLLGSFLRDWLVVSGVVRVPASGVTAWEVKIAPLRAWLPLFFRGLTALLLVAVLIGQLQSQGALPGVLLVGGLGLLSIGLGAAGRLAALAVLVMCGLILREGAQGGLYWAILLAGTGVLLAGTGRYSLWKPEEWLIYHRAGEANLPE